MRNVYIGIIVFVGLALLAAPARAETVYVSRGPDGELSFSDQPADDVIQVLELAPEPSPLAASAAETSAARVNELLRVADALAASREARERLRAEQRTAEQPVRTPPVAAADPPVVQQPFWFPPLLHPGQRFRGRGRAFRAPPHYGRRYPGSGPFDRRDPRLDDRLLPGSAPRRSSPLPP
ncbi:MAG: DUF4124 domain-containing protein [Pseudomonadota bacterium]